MYPLFVYNRKLRRPAKSHQQFSIEEVSFLEQIASTANFQVLLNNSLLENHNFLLKALSHTLNSSPNRPILRVGSGTSRQAVFKRI